MPDNQRLAHRWIEDRGFRVHDANLVFQTNCPNIDLVVYGRREATYVQVKSSFKPATRGWVTVDGSPWSEAQLYGGGPIYNRHAGFRASFVVLVDTQAGEPAFYVAPPDELERLARQHGLKQAARPKRDGSRRSLGFRKELSPEMLEPWRDAWRLLGEPVDEAGSV